MPDRMSPCCRTSDNKVSRRRRRQRALMSFALAETTWKLFHLKFILMWAVLVFFFDQLQLAIMCLVFCRAWKGAKKTNFASMTVDIYAELFVMPLSVPPVTEQTFPAHLKWQAWIHPAHPYWSPCLLSCQLASLLAWLLARCWRRNFYNEKLSAHKMKSARWQLTMRENCAGPLAPHPLPHPSKQNCDATTTPLSPAGNNCC